MLNSLATFLLHLYSICSRCSFCLNFTYVHFFSAPPQRCTMATTPGDTQTRKRTVAEDYDSVPAGKKCKRVRFLPAPCDCDCQNGRLIQLPGDWEGVELMQCPCQKCGGGRCLVMAMPMLFYVNFRMGLEPVCGGCTDHH